MPLLRGLPDLHWAAPYRFFLAPSPTVYQINRPALPAAYKLARIFVNHAFRGGLLRSTARSVIREE